MNYDPLVDVAMSYIQDNTVALSPTAIEEIKKIFQDFIYNPMDYLVYCERLLHYVDNAQSIEKLKAILDVEDDPIPPSPVIEKGSSNSRRKTRTWTNSEDIRLLKAIHKLGLENWNEVAQYVGNGRTRSQCSQRWIRVLDPRISKANWTKEEVQKLIDLVLLYGEKSWAKVSAKMGNRSDVQCRYRYQQIPKSHLLQSKAEKSYESSPKDESVEEEHSEPASMTPDPMLFTSAAQHDVIMLPQELKLDDQIPLVASHYDVFKSESLFDSSFWLH